MDAEGGGELAFENPLGEKAEPTMTTPSDSDEIRSLRALLTRAETSLAVKQQQANQLHFDTEQKSKIISALVVQVQDEKTEAIENALRVGSLETKAGQQHAEHISPNTVGTLKEGMRLAKDRLLNHDTIEWVWALEFELPPHDVVPGVKRIEDDQPISHELWVLSARLWACDLHCKYVITSDDRRLILVVGATHETLVKEAHEARIPMRLAITRGAIAFHEDLAQFMARNHGGLNEWDADENKWILRASQERETHSVILRDMDGDGKITGVDVDLAMHADDKDPEAVMMKELAQTRISELSDQEVQAELSYRGAVHDAQCGDVALMKITLQGLRERDERLLESEDEHRIFTSALRQRLVKRRIGKFCGINMEQRLRAPAAASTLSWMEDHAVKKRSKIRSMRVHEMLTACGGYRPHSDQTFPKNKNGVNVVAKLGNQFLADPQFVLDPKDGDSPPLDQKMVASGLSPVTYEELEQVVDILRHWTDPMTGPGRGEKFVGTFRSYFPLHHHEELQYLKNQWGSFRVLTLAKSSGYRENGDLDGYAFGHPENIPHEHSFPFSWAWQPIHEIRDYFGEDCALYYSWLGHYTSMLFLCMSFGCVVMAVQPYYGGVDKNPFTLAYSVYVGVWSVSFIEGWKRKEAEFRFLWGSQVADGEEDLNADFVGKLIVTESGRENIVYTSKAMRYLLLATSAAVCFVCISITIAAALAASQVRYTPAAGHPKFCVENPSMCCDIPDCCAGVYNSVLHDLYNPNATCCDGTMGDQLESVCTLNPQGVPLHMDLETDGLDNGICDPDKNTDVMVDIADDSSPCGTWQQKKWQLLSSLLNLLVIQLFGLVYEMITDKLTEFENHRTHPEAQNSLVVKNFVFQFLNNYFMLFYIAFLRDWLSQRNEDERMIASSTLPELQEQMFIVFTGKTALKAIGHSARPFIVKWVNRAKDHFSTKKFLEQQLQSEQASATASVNQALRMQKTKSIQDMQAEIKQSAYEKQAMLMPYEGTFGDFNDRVIQFGYIVLFAPAYPLAPFLAFVNNIIEVRLGGYKMCNGFQRPTWKTRASIGSWLPMLGVLGFGAVITNSIMVAFVGSEMSVQLDIYADNLGNKCDPDTADEAHSCDAGTFSDRLVHWELWARFVLIEHAVMLTRVLIMSVSPTNPDWVHDAEETLSYRKNNVYLTKSRLHRKAEKLEKYSRILQGGYIKNKSLLLARDAVVATSYPKSEWDNHSEGRMKHPKE